MSSELTSVIPHDLAPGDLIFSFGTGPVAWAIKTMERVRRDWRGARHDPGHCFDHVAIVDRKLPDGDWALVQALIHGVIEHSDEFPSRLSNYRQFVVVRCPANRERTVEFARSQIGRKYGVVTAFSFLLTLFTPGFINVMVPQTWICSALAGESLRFGMWLHDWPDIYQVSPAQLFVAIEEHEGRRSTSL